MFLLDVTLGSIVILTYAHQFSQDASKQACVAQC